MNIYDRLEKSGFEDTDAMRRELDEAEERNRGKALALAHERHAEHEALTENREKARKKLDGSRERLERMEERKRELEGRVASLTLAGDAEAIEAAREDYRGLVEKYLPNGKRHVLRDERAYASTEFDPEKANEAILEDMKRLAGAAGLRVNANPHDMPEEGREIYSLYVHPAERRKAEFFKAKRRAKQDAAWEAAKAEGRARSGGTPITR